MLILCYVVQCTSADHVWQLSGHWLNEAVECVPPWLLTVSVCVLSVCHYTVHAEERTEGGRHEYRVCQHQHSTVP
jgi:predicted ABC-type sugar transport system permease subunit